MHVLMYMVSGLNMQKNFKNYYGAKKNDEILLDFIKNNYKGTCCYNNISLFLTGIIEKNYNIENNEDLQQCIMSYLKWSYGEPYNKDNILRKNFVKEAMKECKCNCKECFGEKCYRRCDGFSLTDYYLKSKGVFGIRREWMKYAMLYTDFIDPGKNDKTLRDFLSRNYNGEFCYLKIAEWIVKKTKRHLYYVVDDDDDLIDCIMSYLYW